MSVVNAANITRLATSQLKAAQKSLERAFLDYPLMVYAAPDARRRSRGVPMLYNAILRDALRYGEVYVSPKAEGVACWLPPGVPLPGTMREIRAGLLGLPFGFGWGGFQRLLEYGNWHTKLHHKYISGPHWFLATIGVEPAFQGRGIGGALLEAVTVKADAQRVPCYLETHREETVRLYERHGFVTTEIFQVEGRPVPVWAMLRPTRGG